MEGEREKKGCRMIRECLSVILFKTLPSVAKFAKRFYRFTKKKQNKKERKNWSGEEQLSCWEILWYQKKGSRVMFCSQDF